MRKTSDITCTQYVNKKSPKPHCKPFSITKTQHQKEEKCIIKDTTRSSINSSLINSLLRLDMAVDFAKLKISGGIFQSETVFDLFHLEENNNTKKTSLNQNKSVRGMLIYGKNGSGKSTIAKAFRKLKGEAIPELSAVAIEDKNGIPLPTEKIRDVIYVFDEDYIEKNIRLQQEGLKTIAILGQSVSLTEKIDKLQKKRSEKEGELEQLDKSISELEDKNKNNKASIAFIDTKIRDSLRGNDRWAGRAREIENTKKNKDVSATTFKRIANLNPKVSRDDLVEQFKLEYKKLTELRNDNNRIIQPVPSLNSIYLAYSDQDTNELLAQHIENPKLSEREKYILNLAKTQGSQVLQEKLRFFKQEQNKICPYCFQGLTDDYKKLLIDGIEKFLNQTVKNHITALEKLELQDICLNLSPFKELEEYENCISLHAKLNNEINNLNSVLQQKKEKPYIPIKIGISKISPIANQLSTSLGILEKQRKAHNEPENKIKVLTSSLMKINDEISYYDIIDDYNEYKKRVQTWSEKSKNRKEIKSTIDRLSTEIDDLTAQKRNTKIAVEEINEALRFIFYDQHRLQINHKDDSYTITVRGQDILPSRISTGERNAIALCYFFTSILAGEEKDAAYSKQHLLVVDDPLSSFDRDNQVGISSYLGGQIEKFLSGNSATNIIVLTHSLKGFFDLYKTLVSIKSHASNGKSKTIFQHLELKNNKFINFNLEKRQEYSELLKIIFSYAKCINEAYSPIVGNIMRQVLEAFSTFTYKKGIADLCANEAIIANLPPDIIPYYKNLMYQLVLHSGSHKEGQVATLDDMNFSEIFSDEEKQKTAKDIICLLFFFNKNHVLEHLKEIPNTETLINRWCEEIQLRCKSEGK